MDTFMKWAEGRGSDFEDFLEKIGYNKIDVGQSLAFVRSDKGIRVAGMTVRVLAQSELSGSHIGVIVKKNLTGPAFKPFAKGASLASIRDEYGSAEFFTPEMGAEVCATAAVAKAGYTIAKAEVGDGMVTGTVGVGTKVGGGIVDDSLALNVGFGGVKVGRKIGFSVMGTGVEVDLKKVGDGIASWFGYK